MYQRYENINLNKIQRSNKRVSQDKEFLETNNDSLQNKRSARKYVALLTEGEDWLNGPGKNMLVLIKVLRI